MPKHHWFNETGLTRDQINELLGKTSEAFVRFHQALLPHCWQPADPAQPFPVHEGRPERVGHSLATAFPLVVRNDRPRGRIDRNGIDRNDGWYARMHGPVVRAAHLAVFREATEVVIAQSDRILAPLGWEQSGTQPGGSHHAGCRWTRGEAALTVLALARSQPVSGLYETSAAEAVLGIEPDGRRRPPIEATVDVVVSASDATALDAYERLLAGWALLVTHPRAEYEVATAWPTEAGIRLTNAQAEARRKARNAAADALRLADFGFIEGEDDPDDEDNVLSTLPEVIFRRNEMAERSIEVRGEDGWPVPGAPRSFRPEPGGLPLGLERAIGRLRGHVQLVPWTSPGNRAFGSRLVTETPVECHGLRDDIPNLEMGGLHIRMRSRWTGLPTLVLELKPWEEIPEMLIRRMTSNVDRRSEHTIRKAIWNSLRFSGR